MALYEEVHDDDDYDDYDDYDPYHYSKSDAKSNFVFGSPSKASRKAMYQHHSPRHSPRHHGRDYNAYCKSESNTCHACGQAVPTCGSMERKRRETLTWKQTPDHFNKSDHDESDEGLYNHVTRYSPRGFSKSDATRRREEEVMRRHREKMRESSSLYGAFP